MKVLANDGISASGKAALEANGHVLLETTVAQDQLAAFIQSENIEVLLVRSATKVRKDLIDVCPSLKVIGRGGVGMDNIDVEYAREKGLKVINTPAASSQSVAELVFAHLAGMVRFLHDSNRNMPLEGDSKFKQLKKAYAGGVELKGRTLGIVGFGRIGQALAKLAIGHGMDVCFYDMITGDVELDLELGNGASAKATVKWTEFEDLLKTSDFISLHVPGAGKALIGAEEMAKMKPGSGLLNAARGGVIDEPALLAALESGQIKYAGLDVFENEPTPAVQVLMNGKVSLTPHIGAATEEAQDRIGTELAEQIHAISQEVTA
jgi:D-3-phosphoglycerate dehydrogenase